MSQENIEPRFEMGEEDLSFEKTIARLKDLVDKMETGNLGLEEMITLYAEGSRLVSQCEEKLRSAEGKIRELMEKNEKLTLKKEVES